MLVGFSIFKYAELTKSLSQEVAKDLQVSAAKEFRRQMALRSLARVRQGGHGSDAGRESAYDQVSSTGFKSFRRIPLSLQLKPFGMVRKGHAVAWVQQIVENTVNTIFMVTVTDARMFF